MLVALLHLERSSVALAAAVVERKV